MARAEPELGRRSRIGCATSGIKSTPPEPSSSSSNSARTERPGPASSIPEAKIRRNGRKTCACSKFRGKRNAEHECAGDTSAAGRCRVLSCEAITLYVVGRVEANSGRLTATTKNAAPWIGWALHFDSVTARGQGLLWFRACSRTPATGRSPGLPRRSSTSDPPRRHSGSEAVASPELLRP